MSKHKRAPSPALVISLIALFVALGSGAYAAAKIGTKDIKKEAVTGKKLAENAVKSNKTKDGGLKGKDLKDETVTESKIGQGAVTGSRLADGAVKAKKLGEITEVSDTTTVATFELGTASVTCPAGTRVISGGFDTDSDAGNQGLAVENRRVDNGWRVTVYAGASNGLAAGNVLTVYAYCLENGA